MSIATLADIITKIRRLTASGTSLQLTDVQIKDYINSYYLYDLPAFLRCLKLNDVYTFNTSKGINVYAFDSEAYTTIMNPCYIAKRPLQLFQDPSSFYSVNINWQFQEILTTGTGAIGQLYTGTTTSQNLVRSVNNDPTNINYPASRVQNILITAQSGNATLNVTDDGNGLLIGDVNPLFTNTINYVTGAVSLKFSATVDAGSNIFIEYNAFVQAIPTSILYFQNQFTLRPIPDKGYTVELTCYRQPTQALMDAAADAGIPELREWWELIAVGASKKVYEDRLDFDGVQMMDKMLIERMTVAETRTYAQLGTKRIGTIFANQTSMGGYGSGGYGYTGY